MNIKITHNWLLEYLDTKATPEEIRKYLSLCGPSVESITKCGDDYIYGIEITSNRIDTASVIGIAREAHAILSRFGIKATLKPFEPKTAALKPRNLLPVSIRDPDNLCRRLLAVVMDNIHIGPSKQYIKDRLNAAGIRSLNNVVDITNYVMIEIGHPTHVFDYDRIKTHTLLLRRAKQGEKITTLDDKIYSLDPEDIIIDDGTGRVIDLPGIMGTANSVVTSETKRILFFTEANDPVAIRHSSLRYGIRTVAATINEKNPDPEAAHGALLRGMELFTRLAGAHPASGIVDVYPHPQPKKSVSISLKDISRSIGVDIPKNDVVNILKDLDFVLKSQKDDTLMFQVPSYRYNDISIKEDLIEEIARIYGYFNLPNNLQPAVYVRQPKEMELLFSMERRIKYFLKDLGLHEVITYSMISEDLIKNNDLEVKNHLALKNTISEEIKYLRTHLMPSLIKNIKDNEGKEDNLRFFEISKTYKPRTDELPVEEYKLGIVTNTDYYDLKGIVDALLREFTITEYSITKSAHPLLAEHAQGEIIKGKDWIGEFGQLKNTYQARNGVKSNVFLAVFDLSHFIRHAQIISSKYQPVNPYATIKLDLTIPENPETPYYQIKKQALKTSGLLTDIECIGTYKNTVTLRFYFSSSERNITEEEAKKELKKIEKMI